MMDEPAIRMWAWEASRGMTLGSGGETRLLRFDEAIRYADQLAAWVMSGKIALTPAQ